MTHSRLGRFCIISLYHKGHATKQYLTNKMCWHSKCFAFAAVFCPLDCFAHLVGFSLDLVAMYTQRTREHGWFPVQETGCFLMV